MKRRQILGQGILLSAGIAESTAAPGIGALGFHREIGNPVFPGIRIAVARARVKLGSIGRTEPGERLRIPAVGQKVQRNDAKNAIRVSPDLAFRNHHIPGSLAVSIQHNQVADTPSRGSHRTVFPGRSGPA